MADHRVSLSSSAPATPAVTPPAQNHPDPLNRFSPINASNSSNLASSSINTPRRVQWVGLTEASDRPPIANPGHVSISVTTPENEKQDPFSVVQSPQISEGNTPESSRPPTPENFGLSNLDPEQAILQGETEGLPIAPSAKPRTFTREAAKLVNRHKRVHLPFGIGSNKKRGNSDISKNKERYSPLTHPAPSGHSQRAAPGGGVLSSLLKLYDNNNDNVSSSTLVNKPSNTSRTDMPQQPSSSGSSPHHPIHIRSHSYDNVPDAVRGGLKGLGKAMGLSVSDRPEAARSGAGVFGALHTSAFNLAGAAAPKSTTIAPVPQRPGYRISRYSAPDIHHEATSAPSTRSASPIGTVTPPNGTKPFSEKNRNTSHRSLSSLGDLLDPKSYHNHSRPYKEARSQPNSPPPELEERGTPQTKVHEKHQPHHQHTPLAKKKKAKSRQEEIFITMHVAAILQRQDFILRFARALMMFGAPTHKLESQIQHTAKILDLECSVIYLFNVMILSFQDRDTHTSEIKFIKQSGGLDLAKLTELSTLHWEVVHDKVGVQDASVEISRLMLEPPLYNRYHHILLGGLCSVFISIASFSASFIDLLMSFVLGCFLVAIQVIIAVKSDVLSNVFELIVAAIISFAAAGLANTRYFCYSAIASSSIVLILPGWITCCAALELQSRSILCGSVRLIWAVIYSLFLGFGISIGAQFWQLISGNSLILPDGNASSCTYARDDAPWWRTKIPLIFALVAVPGYAMALSLKNSARIKTKEFVAMVIISSAGWTVNHYSATGFPGRADISSALGALTVGILGNLWGKFFQDTGFVVSAPAILFQLPSGLSNGGLLNFATNTSSSSASWDSAFTVAQQLITVAIGLVVGLFCSSLIMSPFMSKRRGSPMTF